MYELLKGSVDFSRLTRPASIRYSRVFDTVAETGAPHFLHGVAVEAWRGRLAVCFAFNSGAENSASERLLIRWSDDGARTWSAPQILSASDEYANSHSVFWPDKETLWCFGPRFHGLGRPPVTNRGHRLIGFSGLQTEAFTLDGDGSWRFRGLVAEGFWPLGAPCLMDDGCLMMPGCTESWLAAIAVSRGNDLLRWDVIRPDTDGEVFTEAAAWAQGSDVLAVMRNESVQTDGRYHAAVALSHDFGRAFAPCELSNLPMATTKPFCGRLCDGRPFMVFNESLEGSPRSRARLLLGLGEPGELAIRRLYVLDEGLRAPSGRRLSLSYPYARQIGGQLYVAYSSESTPGVGSNCNDALLAIVDVACLG